MIRVPLFQLNFNELGEALNSAGFSSPAAESIFRHFYKTKKIMPLSKKLEIHLRSQFDCKLPGLVKKSKSEDGTQKLLLKFADGRSVESVILKIGRGFTLCLSTQVGCGMNCSFCFTARQGLERHLSAAEIVTQYLAGWGILKEADPQVIAPDIVFMGQGEPLHNFDQVKKAIEILTDSRGIALGPRQITLSSVGYLPGLRRWTELPPVNLAISLHSPFDDERNELIPLNRAYPLKDLFECLDSLRLLKRQFINFEYLLISGLNDTETHAEALNQWLIGRPAILNIIPFNPFPGSPYIRPTDEEVTEFKRKLVARKIRAMVRVTKGDDILAACGQLNV